MVSVQDILIDAINPSRESVPYSLKISRSKPVAAEEENIFTMVRGTNSPGNPRYFVNFPIISDRKSRKPEALNIPTAVISPIKVGMIFITVRNPFLAPLIKTLYTFTLRNKPYETTMKITSGIMISDKYNKNDIFAPGNLFTKEYIRSALTYDLQIII